MRRLAACQLIAADDANRAGQMAAAAGDCSGMNRRELDDEPKPISGALGYLLGSEQQLFVPGAEYAPAGPGPFGPAAVVAQPAGALRGHLWPCPMPGAATGVGADCCQLSAVTPAA